MQNVHVGPLPPPIGGISVYLYRLSKLEKDAIFIDSKTIFGSKKFKFWFIRQIFDFKKKNFIYHGNSLKGRFIFYFLSCISIHNFSLVIHGTSLMDQYNNSNSILKLFIRKIILRASSIQVVNSDFKNFIYRLNIKKNNVFVKPAFLPPPLEEENSIINSYKKETIDFLTIRNPIIVSNASFLDFYKNEDLYGLDLCIELTNLLKKDYPNIGLLFALSNEKRNISYFKKLKSRIKELKIDNNFYFMTGHRELWPLLKKTDLFVRSTNTDGDSISVREALYFKVPVVASDVTIRPKGCYLFKNRDLNDLYNKSKNILKLI